MNPIRIINTAAGKGLNLVPMPAGGVPFDRLIEIGELHSLSGDALQFAMAKYNKDYSAMSKAVTALRKLSLRLAKRKGWKYSNQKVLEDAAMLAVMQHVEPLKFGHICWSCNGTGGTVNSSCQVCDGTGSRYKPDVLYASVLGVSDTAYRKTWASRVGELYNLASKWDDELWSVWSARNS